MKKIFIGGDLNIFVTMYNWILANTWFKKRESHLIIFKNGTIISQINFIMRCCNDLGLRLSPIANSKNLELRIDVVTIVRYTRIDYYLP